MNFKLRRAFWIALAVNLIVFITIFLLFPDLQSALVGEDLFMENLSATLFLLAGASALLLLITGKSYVKNKILLITAGLGFLCFLEEIGFGERILGLSMPVVGGGKVDGFHDVFKASFLKLQVIPTYLSLSIVVLFILIASVIVYKWRKEIKTLFEQIWQLDILFFTFVSISLLLFATFLDLGLFPFYFINLMEEVLEMNGGLALLFGAISAAKIFKPINVSRKLRI